MEYPLIGALHPKFATIVDKRDTPTGNAQNGDSPDPQQELAPSARVTTGGPISRPKAECHLLWIDGS
jgi:hypothetical protein